MNLEVKTYEEWTASGQDLLDFLGRNPCEVDYYLFQDQLGALPPNFHQAGFMQVGEPFTSILNPLDRNMKDRINLYFTFSRKIVDKNQERFFYLGILPDFNK